MLSTAFFLAGSGFVAASNLTALSTSGVFVHLFEWHWSDIALECEQYLGPMGFAAVQTSPQMEHIQGPAWWTRYQPVSYNTQSRSGTNLEFKDMVKRCAAVGVAIIADPVPNHMAGGSGTGVAGSSYGGRAYPGSNYTPDDFHHNTGDTSSNCQVSDYQDKNNVQQCDLVGLPDLNTGSAKVQGQLASYIKSLLADGVGGVRIDAAKHQDDKEVGAYLALAGSPWNFQEVIWGPNEAVQPESYTHNGHVSEFRWANKVGSAIKNGNFNSLSTLEDGLLASSVAVNFLDNHDTQRGGAPLTYKDGELYRVANIFMLAHPYGFPKVMSSYYFNGNDDGPPSQKVHAGTTLNCYHGQPWVCEHRWQGIGEMVKWRAIAGNSPVSNYKTDGGSQGYRVSFSRGSKAFVAINQGGDNWVSTVQTGLPAGNYCDVIQGLAKCKVVTVQADGSTQISIQGPQALALHIGAKPGN